MVCMASHEGHAQAPGLTSGFMGTVNFHNGIPDATMIVQWFSVVFKFTVVQNILYV